MDEITVSLNSSDFYAIAEGVSVEDAVAVFSRVVVVGCKVEIAVNGVVVRSFSRA